MNKMEDLSKKSNRFLEKGSVLSIIIIALNEGKKLPKLLTSLENQIYTPIEIEVILIDNGSTDNTPDIMGDYINKHNFAKSYKYTENLGDAFNFAIHKAKGKYVTFMGADMGFPLNWLQTIKELIEKYGNKYDAFVAKLIPLSFYNGTFNDYVLAYFVGDTALDGDWTEKTFHNGGLVVKRDKAIEIGFNSKLQASEDADFSIKFLRRGYRVAYLPSKYYVFDEKYYDLRGLMSYFRKRAIGAIMVIKQTNNWDMMWALFKTVVEPITPHYLVTRYKKGRSFIRINYSKWLLAGFARTFIMLYTIILFGPLHRPFPTRVLRRKN